MKAPETLHVRATPTNVEKPFFHVDLSHFVNAVRLIGDVNRFDAKRGENMNVFLAGASGVIGRPLTEYLIAAGHEVTGLTRSAKRAEQLRINGIRAVVGDVFDKPNLIRTVCEAEPDVVIHQLTSLPKKIDPRQIRQALADTNRIRIEGTANLVEAALQAGAKKLVTQSIAFAYEPDPDVIRSEKSPLHTKVPASYAEVIGAVRQLEKITLGSTGLTGIVLRYGFFYGPGTAYDPDGAVAKDVRAGKMPIVGKGEGVFSFIHIDDAAAATLAALELIEPGIYNIVDDDPAAVSEWLPHYASLLGARRPRRVPKWLARLLAGRYAVHLMCEQSGASNAKAKQQLGWKPQYASWRSGFAAALRRSVGDLGRERHFKRLDDQFVRQ